MFSKALFKQSMKAHWVKWVTVTVATCVMLAIVIIVLGSLSINDIRDSLKNIFVQADQESELKEQSIDGYELYLTTVDMYKMLDTESGQLVLGVINNITNEYAGRLAELQGQGDVTDEQVQALRSEIAQKYTESFATMLPDISSDYINMFLMSILTHYDEASSSGSVDTTQLLQNAYLDLVYNMAYETYLAKEDATEDMALQSAQGAKDTAQTAISKYQELGADTDYSALALDYMNDYIYNSVYDMQIDAGLTEDEALQYAVMTKVISNTAITTYQFWLSEDPDITKEQARLNSTQSISDQMPEKVAEALTELGNMDMYGLIIGSIFYRIAGLLLPMVFVIMTANSLLAGQVDSGSMAYVLSTPTKRRTVAVTQMVYLLASLFAMFALLTIVSVIAVFISGGNNFAINYGEILLFNLGAFLTMFAIAGFCYMCSSIFNRTKYSLGIGGGITIFSLVCTILGLFGSSVVPSAMRIEPMNFFNYLSVITLFDTTEILNGSLDFLWKFGILAVIGIVTFIIGVFRFDKKDLPL